MQVLAGIDDIAICTLTGADVVRHRLVQKIIEAYEEYDRKNPDRDGEGDRRNGRYSRNGRNAENGGQNAGAAPGRNRNSGGSSRGSRPASQNPRNRQNRSR